MLRPAGETPEHTCVFPLGPIGGNRPLLFPQPRVAEHISRACAVSNIGIFMLDYSQNWICFIAYLYII